MDLKDQLKHFIHNEILDGQTSIPLTDATELIDDGIIDSMGIMQLLTFLEETFSIKLDEDEMVPENFKSIETISLLVDKKTSSKQ